MGKLWKTAVGICLGYAVFIPTLPSAGVTVLNSQKQRYPSPNLMAALSTGEISQTAKSVTVMIEDDYSNGSGIIVHHSGNRYTILTAAHVVSSPDAIYTITTNDNQQYKTPAIAVKRLPNIDMAALTFESDRSYPVANIASSQTLTEGTSVYVAGFPSTTAAITSPVYNFTDGKVTARSAKGFKDGYGIVYTNRTLPGMSGGGVFDDRGNLVGIHGRGDIDSSLESSEINSGIQIKTGFNLGIPVETFVSRASEMGIILTINLPEPAPSNPVDDLLVSATVKAQQSDYNGAIADLGQAIQRSPREARLYMARGGYYAATGKQDAAVADFSRVIEIDPSQEQAYWHRGNYRNTNRDVFGALEDFSQVIKLNPNNPLAYLMRATLHVTQTDYGAAIDDYAQMIRIDPKNALAYSQRGSMKFIQGDHQGAEADYTKLISINPKDADAYDRRAHVRRYNGNPKGAIADYQAIIKINPKSQRAWEAIADLSKDQKDIDGAIAAYTGIIAINPQNFSPYMSRGELYADQQQFKEAIADYSKVIELKPSEELGYVLRGYAREKFGDRAGAQADFLKLAELNQKSGDLDEAQDWTERANNL
jgi:tetratricopeptide (TPR) repeat protein